MTIDRLKTLRRLLISLLNIIDDELIERGVIACRTVERRAPLDTALRNRVG